MKYIDLHIHSTYSEGALTCQAIIERASENHLAVISLADHNVIDGNEELMKLGRGADITVISGVELYTHFKNKHLHLLGYNFDVRSEALRQALWRLQAVRRASLERAVKQLDEIGFEVNARELLSLPSKYLGFSHIFSHLEKSRKNQAKLRIDLGGDRSSLFRKINTYFGPGAPVKLPHAELPIEAAIKLILKSGGVPILAHPGQQLIWEEDSLILELKEMGLAGIEALSPYHNWHQVEHFLKFARRHHLAITGGSDYHCDVLTGAAPVKNSWDYFKIPFSIYEEFKTFLSS